MSEETKKEKKNYLLTVCMVHSVYSNHIVKYEFKFISDDIVKVFEDLTDTINDSKFVNIENTILKCDSIDNITYKEVD